MFYKKALVCRNKLYKNTELSSKIQGLELLKAKKTIQSIIYTQQPKIYQIIKITAIVS